MGFKSREQAGHAVAPPRTTHSPENTLFKNCRKERRKCCGAASSKSADPHLATALERLLGNRGKELQSDVVEEYVSVSCIACMEIQD